MRSRIVALMFGALLFTAGPAGAQVAWDSPLLLPPSPPSGFGIYLLEAAGGDLGVLATWRPSARPASFGFRFGLAEDSPGDDLAVLGGVDIAGVLTRATNEFPLDVSWVAGGGLSGGDALLLSFPAGVTVGRSFVGDGVRFTPYVTPRVILDAFFDDDEALPDEPPFRRDRDDLDLDFAVDLGIDIAVQPTWLIRFGATLGRDAIAIGIVF